jgi:hypothetical protein
VFVAGESAGALPGAINVGGQEAFLRQYDANGNVVSTRQFDRLGDGYHSDYSVDERGVLVNFGDTFSALPGQMETGSLDAFVRKHDAAGATQWLRQFGTSALDEANMAFALANGGVLVAGDVSSALPGQISLGGQDAFVRQYDANGGVAWTRQFGTSGSETATASSVDANGSLIVIGNVNGAFPGQTAAGANDVFVLRLVP